MYVYMENFHLHTVYLLCIWMRGAHAYVLCAQVYIFHVCTGCVLCVYVKPDLLLDGPRSKLLESSSVDPNPNLNPKLNGPNYVRRTYFAGRVRSGSALSEGVTLQSLLGVRN